jgi:ATP-dependent DNA ligase
MRPMLAKVFKPRYVSKSYYLQPKSDGMRAVWDGYNLQSREEKDILGVPSILRELQEHCAGFPLDGELYAHGLRLQEILAPIRRTVNVEDDIRIKYWMYDTPIAGTFEERHLELRQRAPLGDRFVLCPTHGPFIYNGENLEQLNIFKNEGYEGTILRNAGSLYHLGKRSSDLLKIKDHLTEEFIIQGSYQSMIWEKIIVPEGTPGAKRYADGRYWKNGEGTPVPNSLGGFICLAPNGKTFEVGSGFTDEERQYYWHNLPVGSLCTVKFKCWTRDGMPREPVFVTVRDYE